MLLAYMNRLLLMIRPNGVWSSVNALRCIMMFIGGLLIVIL